MNRKIIQIAVTSATEDTFSTLYALADDGTLWSRLITLTGKWSRVDGLPQEDTKNRPPAVSQTTGEPIPNVESSI